jgi:hypothetical protein
MFVPLNSSLHTNSHPATDDELATLELAISELTALLELATLELTALLELIAALDAEELFLPPPPEPPQPTRLVSAMPRQSGIKFGLKLYSWIFIATSIVIVKTGFYKLKTVGLIINATARLAPPRLFGNIHQFLFAALGCRRVFFDT